MLNSIKFWLHKEDIVKSFGFIDLEDWLSDRLKNPNMPAPKIAEEIGVSVSSIHSLKRKFGLKNLTPRGGVINNKSRLGKTLFSLREESFIVNEYLTDSAATVHTLAEKFNCSSSAISRVLNRNNNGSLFYEKEVLRFWSNIRVNFNSWCWEWLGQKNKQGYGYVGFQHKTVRAHRLSFYLHNGSIPEGSIVCHSCDNPSCINPEHLFAGTQKENMQDMYKKNRQNNKNAPSGENHHNAKLDVKKVNTIKLLLERGYAQNRIAKMFSVSQVTIYDIKAGKTWAKT